MGAARRTSKWLEGVGQLGSPLLAGAFEQAGLGGHVPCQGGAGPRLPTIVAGVPVTA